MQMRAGPRIRQAAFPPFCRGDRGFILIESLTALAVLGVGLLPLAALAPVALDTLRSYEALGHATRAAAELAELGDPGLALSPLQARGVGPNHLRLCQSLASSGDEPGLPGCSPGPRLAVIGPLPLASSGRASGVQDVAVLRVVALWIRP
ncbi:hypothetical protein RA280_22220 [Cupriavidus sp. CV2]|uniref:type IV pilus modification PilV family protein n=1 Tax=Cupriavidus ulmosensis TaxID=3065913 RepID=UPI00296B18AB|nr:hypothetical protein [Cupriavidus sp. CV2]MDW3684418.1 hypothetical protein [Cupriavidus sp. CV2]